MTPETFCEQFATFAEAPNGVAKLRELILQLAVQGKLGTQDPNDEPASAALARIATLKGGMLEGGQLKQDKKFSPTTKKAPPWPAPRGWEWVRLQDVFEISRGGSPRPAGDPQYFGGPIPWITVGEITKDGEMHLVQTSTGLTALGSERSRFIEPDDLLITNSGATLGVPKISRIRGCINDGVALLKCFHSEVSKEYAYLFLTQQTPAFRAVNQGIGQPNLNTPILAGWHFPFPPLAEQRRIVGKVDQLLGLCDELAARQAARREARSALVGATLDRLVSARSSAEFPAHAHRLRDHFDRLFDTPTTIPQLRQAILQLAVQGQLVPQDPDDEPAEVLLEKIRLEKSRLMETVKVKADESLHRKAKVAPPDYHPPGWKWVRFHEVIWCFRGHNPPKCDFVSSPRIGYVRFIQITDFKTDSKAVYVPITKHLKMVRHGEIIMAAYRHIGKVSREMEGAFNVALCKVNEIAPMDRDFIELLIGTDLVKGELLSESERGHIPSMHSDHLLSLWIPVPPLSEQKRIVSKVTELLSLCDALEAKLTQAESASSQLLSAAVHHFLNFDLSSQV